MTPEEVKTRHQELIMKIKEHQHAIEYLRIDLKYLQSKCKHSSSFRSGDYSGASYMYCPDCHAEY
jgi:hypothetical protein